MRPHHSIALATLLTCTALTASDWPQWHGPDRDRASRDPVGLQATTLPNDWTPVWRRNIGPGHSAPVVSGNTLVFLDEKDNQTLAHGWDAAAGKSLWQTPVGQHFGDEFGTGPRCTPFIEDDRVYVQSSRGEFHCLNLESGAVIWSLDFVKDLGARFIGATPGSGAAPRRGYNGSGIIWNNTVILPVGSTHATLVCCDKFTGKELWRSGSDELAYASLVTANLAGEEQVIAFTADALTGTRLTEGALLWRVPLETAAQRHVSTPLVHDDLVLVNSHTFGMAAFRITTQADGCTATPAWRNPDLLVNLGTATHVNGYIYTIGANKDFVCVELATGRITWSEPDFVGAGRLDYTSVIALGNRLLVLSNEGLLRLIQANPQHYTELAQSQVCGNTLAFPAIANGHLFVRDNRSISCFALNQH